MRIVSLFFATALPFVACSGGGSGGVSSTGAAFNGYVDRFASAYCAWLVGCGKRADQSACVTDFNADPDTKVFRACGAAADYYGAHQGALDACLNAKPACSSDDLDAFCPALDVATLEKSCTGTGTTPDASTGGACGSSAANAYKCAGNSIQQCRGGQWVSASSCTCSVSVGDPRKPPYASTCKTASPTGSVECSYAGSRCMLCKPDTGCAGT